MKILITGTSGFLGGALARHLTPDHDVRGIAGRTGFRSLLEESSPVDLLIHGGFEVDFRTAGPSIDKNTETASLLAKALNRGLSPRLLFLSGAAVMGVSREPKVRDESFHGSTDEGFEPYRESAYVRAKISCERILTEAAPSSLVLFPTTVFGPGMKPSTLGVYRTNFFPLPPGGTSFLALNDFLAAIRLAVESPRLQGRFLLNGGNLSFAEAWESARLAHPGPRCLPIPRWVEPLARVAAKSLGRRSGAFPVLHSGFGYKFYSADRFQRETGWHPKVGLAEAFKGIL